MTAGIVGLGLIGGSLAKAYKAAGLLGNCTHRQWVAHRDNSRKVLVIKGNDITLEHQQCTGETGYGYYNTERH